MAIRHQLLISFLFIFISGIAYSQSTDEYQQTLDQANKYYTQGDYINAKASYQYASRLRPSENYPKEKLQKAVEKLREKMALMDDYTKAISEADVYFRQGDYDNAVKKYKEAEKIIPSEGYSEQKIKDIEVAKNKDRADQIAYDDAVYRAEKYVKYNKFSEAIKEYEKALALFPDDKLAKQQIEELRIKDSELSKTLEVYDEVIQNADRLFTLKYYENAKSEFEKASAARPDEDYPKIKIQEIEALLVKKGDYDKIIVQADNLYADKSLEPAKKKYQEALSVYPSESYPKGMIDKINAALVEKKGREQVYTDAIASADKFYASKDYANALKEYESASELKPRETYPQEKIAEIDEIIKEQSNLDQKYDIAIKRGEQFLVENDFTNAKAEFEKAKNMKPSDAVPIAKLSVVTEALKKQEALLASYNTSMSKGQEYLDNGNFDKAKTEFQNALVIFPGDESATAKINEITALKSNLDEKSLQYAEQIQLADQNFTDKDYNNARQNYEKALAMDESQLYPTEQIAVIDKILADNQELQNSFNKAMATGDIYFGNQEYESALAEYQKALALKPDAKIAQEKIAEVNGLLLTVAGSEEDKYNETLSEADGLFSAQKYTEAKLAYIKASNMKQKEEYPKNKIKEIETILSDEATKQAEYNKLVSAADRMLEAGDYEKARERYNEALLILPMESYPQEKLTEIDNKILEQELNVQEQYNLLITDADKLFTQKEYNSAKIKYQNALKLKPNEGHPQQRLADIEQLSSELEKLEDQYSRLIASADMLYTSKEYDQAKAKYIEASALFPEEQHPKKRIDEINLINQSSTQQNTQAYDKAIADGDKFFASASYTKALDSYHQAQTLNPEETYPGEMIDKISALMASNAMRTVLASTESIPNNEEKKFTFDQLDITDRKSSLLVIRIRGIASRNFKVFVNYGKGGTKNGGFILPITPGEETEEFTIPIGKQNMWFSEDNNWITITPQGGSVDVSGIQITKE